MKNVIHVERIYSQNNEMKFRIEICTVLVMKIDKRHLTDGMEMSNQEKIKMLGEKETYNYLGIFEADTLKQADKKE